jgi:uncharacterized protein (DUF1778 family)
VKDRCGVAIEEERCDSAPIQLMVRLDEDSKTCITKMAELRKVSLSDYVRMVTVAQARREVTQAEQSTISLTPEEQLAFWNVLNATPKLTKSQRELGKIMRGVK